MSDVFTETQHMDAIFSALDNLNAAIIAAQRDNLLVQQVDYDFHRNGPHETLLVKLGVARARKRYR